MITARVTYRSRERSFSLEVEGHADYAEEGKDIVCSAASILTYTTAQVIGAMADVQGMSLERGNADIKITANTEQEYNEIRLATLFVGAGFAMLQNDYPEYVKLILDEA